MGALPAYTSLGLTEQFEVQLTGLLSSFIAASPSRLSLRLRPSLYSGQPLAQDEAARVMGVGVVCQGDDRLLTHPRLLKRGLDQDGCVRARWRLPTLCHGTGTVERAMQCLRCVPTPTHRTRPPPMLRRSSRNALQAGEAARTETMRVARS
jgi:hypothetical protein